MSQLQFDWVGAEKSLQRAIELNPNYATAWHWYGECLGLQGRGAEALRAIHQAEKLDPLSLPIKQDVGLIWMRMYRYEEALNDLEKSLANNGETRLLLISSPEFDSLCSDPRFQQMRSRSG